MYKKLTTLSLLVAMAAGSAFATNSNASLTMQNDSTKYAKDPSVYTWRSGTSTDGNWSLLDANAAITYALPGQTLCFNRNAARDFTGTMTIADGSTGNYLYMGYPDATGNQNTLGFWGGKIVGSSAATSELTISTYSGTPNSFFRVSGNTTMTVTSATVNFDNLNMLLQKENQSTSPIITYLTVLANGTSTIYWNPTIREGKNNNNVMTWDSNITPQFYSGVKFQTNDNTSANVTIGTAAAVSSTESAYNYRNIQIQDKASGTRMNVAFADQSKQINLSAIQDLAINFATLGGTADQRLNLALSADNDNVEIHSSFFKYTTLTLNSASSAFNVISLSGQGHNTFNINADAVSQIDIVGQSYDAINIAAGKTWTVNGRVSISGINALVLGFGATLETTATSNSGTAANNITRAVTLGTGATFQVAGGMRLEATNNIDGNLIIGGAGARDRKNVDSFIFGNAGIVTFGENATLSQHLAPGINRTRDDSSLVQNWSGSNNSYNTKITSNAAAGALDFGNQLNFVKGTTVTMNTSNAFIIGSDESWAATDQASSVFTLANAASFGLVDGSGITTFTINAANEIGSFAFEDTTDANFILKLVFGEDGSLTVGEDASLTSFALDGGTKYQVQLEDSILTNKLRVFDLTQEEIEANFVVSDTETYMVKAIDAGSGSYWVNVVAVPEPATAAFAAGLLAMALAFYRRRR